MRSFVFVINRFFWRGLHKSKATGFQTLEARGASGISQAQGAQSRCPDGLGRIRAQSGDFSGSAFRNLTHQLFVNTILRRVTNSQSNQLRRRAAEQFSRGNSAPFLALLGVSLASGSGLITKEDEQECVCKEVRKTSRRLQHVEHSSESDNVNVNQEKGSISVKDIHFGSVIAKGCNAVVYSASWNNKNDVPGAPVDEDNSILEKEKDFPLAVKIMFNYDIESNATSILRAMQREIVVSRSVHRPDGLPDLMPDSDFFLPPHPNLVKMVTAFADSIPNLDGSMDVCPAALPQRLNPTGYGRNMSLFLVMKRYNTNLRVFLQQEKPQRSWRASLAILAQVLEGISHLVAHDVCHRDLKSDNILVSCLHEDQETNGGGFPHVVISDFGCCLADKKLGLRVPFSSCEVDRGGNAALMAPEISTAQPGLFKYLDYTKVDVWAAGTIAYEIFGSLNPFYCDPSTGKRLDSRTYKHDELPDLPDDVPRVLNALVKQMLERNPNKRLSADQASTICQLLMWAPRSWIDPKSPIPPNTQDILQWLLTMTTKVICESKFSNSIQAHFEYQLVSTFLSRVTLNSTREALDWITENY